MKQEWFITKRAGRTKERDVLEGFNSESFAATRWLQTLSVQPFRPPPPWTRASSTHFDCGTKWRLCSHWGQRERSQQHTLRSEREPSRSMLCSAIEVTRSTRNQNCATLTTPHPRSCEVDRRAPAWLRDGKVASSFGNTTKIDHQNLESTFTASQPRPVHERSCLAGRAGPPAS